jgi:hypothetical protein
MSKLPKMILIQEPSQSFEYPNCWICPVCGRLLPHKALARWHCQLPGIDDLRWAKLIKAAEVMP